jgi:microcin C transport system substrate-binding protein
MRQGLSLLISVFFICAAAAPSQAIVRGKPVHGLALHGAPKYGPGEVFDYVNPDAPKGGTFRIRADTPTFDSFNPFVVKGTPAAGLTYLGANSYFTEGLTTQGSDEPFTQYCLLCETMELAEDSSWIEFVIRSEAKFHDGSPVTADDVIFSFETLMEKGHPFYKFYWGDVEKAEKRSARAVRFYFSNPDNAELPLVMGQLPILSKLYWREGTFESGSLDIPVSSGPYKISSFEPGRFVIYTRDQNYWGKDIVVTAGTHNFDEIRIDYFRDTEVAFEAFKAYQFDHLIENTALRWATGYDEGLIESGAMKKESFEDGMPDNTQGFVMNLRRSKFTDRRVREALGLAFDFDWSNKTLAYGQYAPMGSFFSGSELAATGLPQRLELEILEKYRGQVPDEVFNKPFSPTRTDGSGNNRANLLKARQMLTAAGWEIQGGMLTNSETGENFEFEFLLGQAGLEKWITPYLRNLERLGIKGSMRTVDSTQYVNRINAFDFDMMVGVPSQSISTGNEQREFWGSEAADRPGSRNWSGIKDAAIDAIVEGLIASATRESLVAHTRALDRVLLWNHYFVPELSVPATRHAYWNKFGRPKKIPLQGPDLTTWWYNASKAAVLDAKFNVRSGD